MSPLAATLLPLRHSHTGRNNKRNSYKAVALGTRSSQKDEGKVERSVEVRVGKIEQESK